MSEDDDLKRLDSLAGRPSGDDEVMSALRKHILADVKSAEDDIPEEALRRGREQVMFAARRSGPSRFAPVSFGLAAGFALALVSGALLDVQFGEDSTAAYDRELRAILASKKTSIEVDVGQQEEFAVALTAANAAFVFETGEKDAVLHARVPDPIPEELQRLFDQNNVSARPGDFVSITFTTAKALPE